MSRSGWYMAILDRRHPAKSERSPTRLHWPKAVLSPITLSCQVISKRSEEGVPDGKQRNESLKQEHISSHHAALRREIPRNLSVRRHGIRRCPRGRDTILAETGTPQEHVILNDPTLLGAFFFYSFPLSVTDETLAHSLLLP